ncbi:vitamin K-dependent gamma-carboxylase-like protein [Pontibacter ummariensis]|uniref:Vitamin K-dependent gamma-carboxylase n=1 Tax=Pontibacter ummariensis TaxID=1610492 RepID=A0A239I178_9BACT|nr:HTTM domain-containing protein [Pontibacter ummariensis]PRY10172.1 vitamin K-dependent gamma-carboxylase-like protein [Pontibacter ummariensis]SNS87400.1 Vitamin K-dependent gamma-carboxylase [Pontibacter ummariensis]
MLQLLKPISIYPLVYFRIVFGLLMLCEGIGAVLIGWVQEHYVAPTFHFGYIGLEWLKPLPGDGMVYVYLLMALLGFLILVGWRYKLVSFLFFLLFGYSFFCEKTHYLNHHYLIFLISGLMVLLPAHRKHSLDVRRQPELESAVAPQWTLWLLRVQLLLVYFYAGVAKVQPDWLAAKPMSIWMSHKTDFYVIGPYLNTPEMIWLVCWGGVLFDFLIGFALLWPRTRMVAFWVAFAFHIFNSAVFHVGIFPYFMIAANVLFFSPAQIARWFFRKDALPAVGCHRVLAQPVWQQQIGVYFFILYLSWQLVFPLRHFFIPGDVNWTEEGHRFSWRMMLRTKSGSINFIVQDATMQKTVTVRERDYLTRDQVRELAKHPDMIWQFAQFLKEEYKKQGMARPQVYVRSYLSLNGYGRHPIVDGTVDLASVPYTRGAKAWVTPRPEADGWPWSRRVLSKAEE